MIKTLQQSLKFYPVEELAIKLIDRVRNKVKSLPLEPREDRPKIEVLNGVKFTNSVSREKRRQYLYLLKSPLSINRYLSSACYSKSY